jgi:Flp pilus assembly protein TadG
VVLTALLIMVMLAMVAFSVDVAYMQLVRSELRAVSDLAARAGTETVIRTQDPAQARTVVKQIASANMVANNGLDLRDTEIIFGRTTRNNDGTMTFTANSTPYNSCQVNATRTPASLDGNVPLFFGKVLGVNNFAPVQTSTVVRGGRRRDISLVVDRSGSMDWPSDGSWSGPSKWDDLLVAFDYLKGALEATNEDVEQLALSSYSSGSSNDQMMTTNYNAVRTALRSKYPNGSTNITAGVNSGLQDLNLARTDSDVEKVLVVMTDGLHNVGAGPMTTVNTINNRGVRLITITFGYDADQTGMQQFAAACNGSHFHAPSGATLQYIFTQIGLGNDGLQYLQ